MMNEAGQKIQQCTFFFLFYQIIKSGELVIQPIAGALDDAQTHTCRKIFFTCEN